MSACYCLAVVLQMLAILTKSERIALSSPDGDPSDTMTVNIKAEMKHFNFSSDFYFCYSFLDQQNHKLLLSFSEISFYYSSSSEIYSFDLINNTYRRIDFFNRQNEENKVIKVNSGVNIFAFISLDEKSIYFTADSGKTTWSFYFKQEISKIVLHPSLQHYIAVVLKNNELHISQDSGHKFKKYSESVQDFVWFYQNPNFYYTKHIANDQYSTSLIKGTLLTTSASQTILERCNEIHRKDSLFFAIYYENNIAKDVDRLNVYVSLNDGPLKRVTYPEKDGLVLADIYANDLNEIYIDTFNETHEILYGGSYKDMLFTKISAILVYENEYKACKNFEFFKNSPGIIYSRIYYNYFEYDSLLSFNFGRTWLILDYQPYHINQYCDFLLADRCIFRDSRFLTFEFTPNLLLAFGKTYHHRIDGLFISEDFGRSWNLGKTSVSYFTALDQGGIIVAFESDGNFHYSIDHGANWRSVTLSKNITVEKITTFEHDDLKQVIILAHENVGKTWTLINVDFSSIFKRNCSREDYIPEPKLSKAMCILGKRKVALKRKLNSFCFNMEKILNSLNDISCICSENDLKCNYGYRLGEYDCEPDPDFLRTKVDCQHGEYISDKPRYSFYSDNTCKRRDQIMPNYTHNLCHLSESENVLIFKTEHGVYYTKFEIKGYGLIMYLNFTMFDVISYDIDLYKRELYLAYHDGIYKMNYGLPEIEQSKRLIKVFGMGGIRQIAWDYTGNSVYFSTQNELKRLKPDDKAIQTLLKKQVSRFYILSDVGTLVYSEHFGELVDSPFKITVCDMHGRPIHDFNSSQNVDAVNFLHESKTLLVNLKIRTLKFNNFIPGTNFSIEIINHHVSDKDVVNVFRVKNHNLVVRRNQIRFKNIVTTVSDTITGSKLLLKTNYFKTCLSAQCSHFCQISHQIFTCSCPDGMKLQGYITCTSEFLINCSSADAYKCNSGECVEKTRRCDGIYDCSDSSDEIGCQKECLKNEYLCDDKITCVDSSAVCNGRTECPDGSDEKYCLIASECKPSEFKCDNLKCIPSYKVLDGVNDCGDNSDEKYSRKSICRDVELSCEQNCIKLSQFCDGNIDCSDRSDEIKCKKYSFGDLECFLKCGDKCVQKTDICNGFIDCEDGSDESSCVVKYECPGPKMQKCITGIECFKVEQKCDGFSDCIDGSDEYKCHLANNCTQDSFVCQENACVEMNDYCNGIKDCENGNDEPQFCAASPLIVNFIHTYTSLELTLEWNGSRLGPDTFYEITLRDWDTNNYVMKTTQQGSKKLTMPHSGTCHRFVAVVKLANITVGRQIQFSIFNEIKAPTQLNYIYNENLLVWKYPEELCIPITYFVFCYLENTLIFKSYTFDSIIRLDSSVDTCKVCGKI
ncbi:Sortilin-related receptor [Thelohanellus kitauei]|uniref:Sortilin-related receptor n=1 Tax=Thelohanellus kitauei TaxID=669202 RepID=A0A0C2MUM7_THEKT|nr:Sortilin-related receptor [Thelohanellus kitauei]